MYSSDFNDNQINHLSTKSIDNLRDNLKLSASNDVLVAFTWVHDEQVKATEKNLEFLAADFTFNINQERCELVSE